MNNMILSRRTTRKGHKLAHKPHIKEQILRIYGKETSIHRRGSHCMIMEEPKGHGNRAVNLGIKTGSQMSVTESAPGKLFAAYLPAERTHHLIDRELSERGIGMDSLTDEIMDIRQKGYCVSTDSVVPGITAVSCPALDINGNIAAALTVVFMTGALDTSATSEFIQLLQQKGSELSRALGYTLK